MYNKQFIWNANVQKINVRRINRQHVQRCISYYNAKKPRDYNLQQSWLMLPRM